MVGGIGFIVFLLLRSFVVEGAYYKVQTQTGGSDGAGTDAKVFIRIFGVGGVKQTSRHELDTNGDDDFEKGNLDTFDINDNTDVGMPEYIKIYRKSHAFFGNWQLSWIRVTHNGKEFLFPYYGWVAHSRWIKINVKGKPPGLKLVSDDSSAGAYYKVQTQTGSSDGAGTDAKVFIRIFGVGGVKQTSRHELDTNGDDDFEEGNLDTFDVNDNTDVGMPEYIKIYRKSHAYFGNWQLSWIRVTHNGKEFLFPYYGWVAHSRWIKINGKCKPPGLELASNDSCVDVNECATSPCKENSVCKNLVGSFKCECNDGYKPKDQLSCEDINECIGDSHKCNYKTSECVNTPGEYHCKCNSGFKKVSRYECKDKNECVEGSHTCNTTTSKCVNLHGDFYCKCKTGYHQTDSMKLCMKDECAPLARPYKSIIEPARCTQNRANYYGDVCTVRCENGYVLENPNLNSVSCGANRKWNTNTPRCTAVKCPVLLAPTNGRLLPSSCLTEGNKYQGQCTYICNKGYQLSGSPVRECRADKTWTGSKPTCIKVVVKPWIRCPIDIMVNLAPGQKTADVSSLWKEPSYLGEILLVDPPTANAKFRFPAGETKITWTTRNAAGSDSCSILVMVYDKENPKIVTPCPASPVGVLTTTSSATVTWQEPAFSDNVGVTKVTLTRKSGEVFGLGSWNVYYTAYDKAGNTATCEFVVTVKIQGCPELKGPYGGDRKCSSFGQIKYCTITCPSDKQIYKNPSPYSVWTCNSAKWDPTPAVPDCVAAALKDDSSCTGNQVEMAIAFSSGSKTYCADCPRGTYSSNGKCKPCAAGQYQDQQGSATCKDCASGTSSLAGANDVKQCRVVCRPGHYSVDGMDPGCQLCPKNTYQNNPKATSCIPCPAGTTTLSLGMSKLSHCGAKPVITSVTPKTKTIDERQSTSISCYVTGSPTPSITLKFRRNISAGFLGQETREFLRDSNGKVIGIKLTITGATYENSGNYECSAENPFGKVVELSTLTVNQVFGSGADASFDVDDLI